MTDENTPPAAPDAGTSNNPLATWSCYLGLASFWLCFVGAYLGPVAIVVGLLALRARKPNEAPYGMRSSTTRAWCGIIAGAIGTVMGIHYLGAIKNFS